MNQPTEPLLPHGGYRKLSSYVIADAVDDDELVTDLRHNLRQFATLLLR